MEKKRVAVALSGGVDSAYSAYLLVRRGFEVAGVTFKTAFTKEESIERARYVCQKIGIPHYIVDVTEEFEQMIISYFINSYLEGLTPNPCGLCNLLIKFGVVFDCTISLGYDYFATGHYAGIFRQGERVFLTKGRDESKSQEYFLSLVPQERLKKVFFPLSDYTKEEIKESVTKIGFWSFDVEESQEICFVKERSYRDFIKARIKKSSQYWGEIKYRDGRVLGKHKGIYSFTYGQREGLGISWRKALYVLDINPYRREVIVGERDFVFREKFFVKELNWFYPERDYENLEVKVRYNSSPLPCRVERVAPRRVLCLLKEKRELPPPGQLAVFYEGRRVVAGGWIEKEGFRGKI